MGIGIHFDNDEEDDYDGSLLFRHWRDDVNDEHYCPQPSSSESWDEIQTRWLNYIGSLNDGTGVKSYKLFDQWLKDNYNPPTRK